MAIQLKKVSNLETLALGFNYEGEIIIKDDVPTGGAVDIQFNSAELIGTVGKVGLVVDQHVPADNSGSTDYTSYAVTVGDTADPNGQIASVELCPAGTEAALGTIFVNTGDDAFGTVVSNVGATFTAAGDDDEALALGGKVRLFFEYYPTAGDNFSG